MKQAIISGCVLLALAVAVCVGSTLLIRTALDRMSDLHEQTLSFTDANETEQALDSLTQTAEYWSKCSVWMEMLTDHEDIHSVREQIVSAKALLEHDDIAQYHQCMALLRESLDHLRRHESMALSNVF